MTEPTAGTPVLSIVLPVHNQADHIAGVVDGYVQVLDRIVTEYEIVLVTNACTDQSAHVCQTLAERHDNVRTIDRTAPGWGGAVRAGVAAARGEHICYTNSARTSPEILALLIAYHRAYPEVVLKANRKVRDSWQRRLGSLLYNLECRALFDTAAWDVNGTPKVFPRSFTKLLELRRDDDLIDAEFALACQREGYPLIEVPVLATQRHGGRSTTNYTSALRMYLGAVTLYRQARR
jgi:glycosyltransferase involved in cell wall biosynthesis